ncbi:RidA family protein [bacterium]|nr:RidA family protein [bacterium]
MQSVMSGRAPKPIGPYSQAIKTEKWLYLSGQISLDPISGTVVGDNIKEQTRQVFENLKAVLAAGGANFSQVVKMTIYMADLKEFTDLNEVYAEYFTKPYPARSTVQVAGLPKGARVEMDAVAWVGKVE